MLKSSSLLTFTVFSCLGFFLFDEYSRTMIIFVKNISSKNDSKNCGVETELVKVVI